LRGGNDAVGQAVASVLSTHGKIGILVDDTAGTVTRRTARELYGAEVLPRWWISVRSIACAIDALKAVEAGPDDAPVILICDRFLPRECGQAQTHPWDEHQEETAGELLGLVSTVQKNRRFVETVFHTSYPDARTSKIAWESRNPEVMRRVRRKLAEDAQTSDLLRYGPTAGEGAGRAGRSRWREVTHALALRLAGLTGNNDPVILITGAGASLAARLDSPGMPRTCDLLDAAHSFRRALRAGRATGEVRARHSFIDPPAGEGSCACELHDGEPRASQLRAHSVEDLLGHLDRGASAESVEWNLLELFSKSGAEGQALAYALKCVMLRYDTGFPFQHWLLAQLPWTSIITTNFDCYHERAALHVVSRAQSAKVAQAAYDFAIPGQRYHKVYGSLSAAETLALGRTDFEERWRVIRRLLATVIGDNRRGLIVFLGHAMQDPCFHAYLTSVGTKLRDWKFLWVVPEAETAARGEPGLAADWLDVLRAHSNASGRPDVVAGPLSGRALDFANDLYLDYVREAGQVT
jgi:hypothetical protein